MIISHKYRFIFVKTLKTAGTSIEVFLSQHCGPDDVVTPILPHVEPHLPRNHDGYFNHMPAWEIRDAGRPRNLAVLLQVLRRTEPVGQDPFVLPHDERPPGRQADVRATSSRGTTSP